MKKIELRNSIKKLLLGGVLKLVAAGAFLYGLLQLDWVTGFFFGGFFMLFFFLFFLLAIGDLQKLIKREKIGMILDDEGVYETSIKQTIQWGNIASVTGDVASNAVIYRFTLKKPITYQATGFQSLSTWLVFKLIHNQAKKRSRFQRNEKEGMLKSFDPDTIDFETLHAVTISNASLSLGNQDFKKLIESLLRAKKIPLRYQKESDPTK
jgi:hypothetical protein